jgi:enhancer of yellow 2 transcription factor
MADVNRESEQEFKSRLNTKLQNSGEIERLKQLLRERLETSGWTDQMKSICKEKVRNQSIEQVTIDELVQQVTPLGRDKVPAEIKQEILLKLRTFLEEES